MEVCLQSRKAQKIGLRRKVKTGCRTCKIRKVKCDEGKPTCSRCLTTGRICDGYGVWGGGGNTYAERYAPAKQPQKPLTISIEKGLTKTVALEELRYLQLFRLRFIHTVSGWFGTYFWTQIVLPATALEPAILHAVIALSAAHRCEFQESLAPDVRERFMLQQYSRAMQLLQSMIQHQDGESIKIVLIACQIFTFLEYLRGRPTVAEAHLLNGMRLLGNVQKGGGSVGEVQVPRVLECRTGVDRGIVQRFAALHIQSSLFGRHLASSDIPHRPLETEIPFPTFSSVDEAKDLLDDLLQRVLLLSQQFEQLPKNSVCPSALLLAKDQVVLLLTTWLQTYHRTNSPSSIWHCSATDEALGPLAFGSRRLAHGINTRERLAYTLLLNYHAMARIIAQTLAPRGSPETRYAAHTADFLAILEGSIEIWKTYALAREIPGNVELANSIGEFGPTPPLYYVAVKCRVSRIRRHAVRLLGVVGYKEGVWDTALVASVAGKVVELEEGSRSGWWDAVEEKFSLHEVPRVNGEYEVLPETRLFHDVKVDIPEESAVRALVMCKRWTNEGDLEVLRYQFNGERWDEGE